MKFSVETTSPIDLTKKAQYPWMGQNRNGRVVHFLNKDTAVCMKDPDGNYTTGEIGAFDQDFYTPCPKGFKITLTVE